MKAKKRSAKKTAAKKNKKPAPKRGRKRPARPSSARKAPPRAKARAARPKRRRAAPASPRGIPAPPNGILLGRVEDYFAHIGVAALTLSAPLALGAHIHVLGHTTSFEQTIDSMQIDHQPVTRADKSAAVGIKVTSRARRGDHVYLLP